MRTSGLIILAFLGLLALYVIIALVLLGVGFFSVIADGAPKTSGNEPSSGPLPLEGEVHPGAREAIDYQP